jgi:hypothetical protein
MAATIGVRSWSASTPVPSPRVGAAAPAAARIENASAPVTSAVQKERYPSDSARDATSRAPGTPRAGRAAMVTPKGTSRFIAGP